MTKYGAILFDLDGTLTRSEPGITNCVQYALEKMGHPGMSLDMRRKFIGPPLFESFQQLAGMNGEDAARAVEVYRERFSTLGWRENSVYEGIPDLLRALKKQGVYLAVASAKPLKFVEQILVLFGLRDLFDRVEAIRLTEHHADKAEIVSRALPKDGRTAAMVGDRRFDMEGARQMGVAAVGVSYGYGGREELINAGADHVCDTVEDLARALGCENWKQRRTLTVAGNAAGHPARIAAEILCQMGYETCFSDGESRGSFPDGQIRIRAEDMPSCPERETLFRFDPAGGGEQRIPTASMEEEALRETIRTILKHWLNGRE